LHKQPSQINIWHGQLLHFISVFILLMLVWYAWASLGKPYPLEFWLAVACPIIHQIFVWLSWRLELTASLTSKFIGFHAYVGIFFVLFASRFISLGYLAWLDANSLGLSTPKRILITVIFLALGIYTMYSVKRYFGLVRAAGADHFDVLYRSMPFVKEGIFRFTNNAMYLYAFLLFWAVATGFNSAAALVVAAFSHVYIWVHFYCTEKPDIDLIYGPMSH